MTYIHTAELFCTVASPGVEVGCFVEAGFRGIEVGNRGVEVGFSEVRDPGVEVG